MRNILEKSYTKCGRETVPRPFPKKLNHTQNVVEKPFPDLFLKNQNLAYLLINILKFYIYIF